MNFLECKRFYHDRIQNYLSKIIGKECDLSKWYHTKDKSTERDYISYDIHLRTKGWRGIKVSKQVKKPTNFFAICCSQF